MAVAAASSSSLGSGVPFLLHSPARPQQGCLREGQGQGPVGRSEGTCMQGWGVGATEGPPPLTCRGARVIFLACREEGRGRLSQARPGRCSIPTFSYRLYRGVWGPETAGWRGRTPSLPGAGHQLPGHPGVGAGGSGPKVGQGNLEATLPHLVQSSWGGGRGGGSQRPRQWGGEVLGEAGPGREEAESGGRTSDLHPIICTGLSSELPSEARPELGVGLPWDGCGWRTGPFRTVLVALLG